jgi:type IV fimbrial biogenesis protein FimT
MHLQTGQTLVELAVTLAVAGTLASGAVAGFTGLQRQARMSAAANALVHGIHVARQAALVRGTEIVLCRSPDGRQCVHAGDWGKGFIVFANDDGDSPPRVDPGEAILEAGDRFPGGFIGANRSFFVLRPPGRRSVNGTLWLCDDRGEAAARVVVVSHSGRPRAAPAHESPTAVSCPS